MKEKEEMIQEFEKQIQSGESVKSPVEDEQEPVKTYCFSSMITYRDSLQENEPESRIGC